ncbi:MAG: 4-hydroxy-tetrahydrodipicolinate synthase [Bacteroidetes bacterium]|nr:4-hydroxy-tetrahydrodipicolinate synthase [Bacteroidota bacterium]
MNNLSGTGVAIVTPFELSGEIDFEGLTKLLNHIISNGVDFVVALGTTSEAVTLSKNEKSEVVQHVLKVVNGRTPVIIGIGGNNTASVIEEIKSTDFEGISGILSVAPYYNKPNQRGIYEHFKAIASECSVPIILYNVPGRTSSNIDSETCIKLAHNFRNIIAVKEASGDLTQIMEIISSKPHDFNVLSGDDALTFPMVALGAKGVISVVANSFPAEFSTMVKHALNGENAAARKIHYSLLSFIDMIFREGNPAGVKAALEIQGIMKNNLRLPMVPVTKLLYDEISQEVNKLK